MLNNQVEYIQANGKGESPMKVKTTLDCDIVWTYMVTYSSINGIAVAMQYEQIGDVEPQMVGTLMVSDRWKMEEEIFVQLLLSYLL